jgi:hypothetical protein
VGLVFDGQLEYSRQLSPATPIVSQTITENTGFFHCNQFGNPQNLGGDVTARFTPLLGAGVYELYFEQNGDDFSIILNLIDANWATGPDGIFRSILIDPVFAGLNSAAYIYVSHADADDNTIYSCGGFINSTAEYWDLVRDDPNTTTYARDRAGFSIDPNYTGPDPQDLSNIPQIPFGVSSATLDVDATIKDDIIIPSGKTFIVTTDDDVINSPLLEQTEVMFEPGTGLTVESGGTLLAEHAGPFGVSDWFCPSDPSKGGWDGIVGEPNATISMNYALIIAAENGLRLEQTAGGLHVVEISDSRHLGLHIKDCGPFVNISNITESGDYTGIDRGTNVLIEGSSARPKFIWTGVSNAIKSEQSGVFFGGHGVEIVGADSTWFYDCNIFQNDSTGFYIRNTIGPYIEECRVNSNGKNLSGAGGSTGAGIYVREGSQWTTLRYSRVYNNIYGIHLHGAQRDYARLRGWYHPDHSIDPGDPADLAQITETEGRNCIYENTHNVFSKQYGRLDLGSLYYNQGGVQVPLGHMNSIFDPVSTQGRVDTWSHGGFEQNWWNNNYSLFAYNNSTLEMGNELAGDSAVCFEMGKRAADPSGSLTSDILLYRRTRGSLSLPGDLRGSNSAHGAAPATFLLGEPWPNPFNPQTSIAFTLFDHQDITLSINDHCCPKRFELYNETSQNSLIWTGRATKAKPAPPFTVVYIIDQRQQRAHRGTDRSTNRTNLGASADSVAGTPQGLTLTMTTRRAFSSTSAEGL